MGLGGNKVRASWEAGEYHDAARRLSEEVARCRLWKDSCVGQKGLAQGSHIIEGHHEANEPKHREHQPDAEEEALASEGGCIGEAQDVVHFVHLHLLGRCHQGD